MIDTEIPATYGYFYLQTVFFDKRNVIKNMKHYEKLLGRDVNKLIESCKETLIDEMLMSWEISEASGLTQQDLTRILLSTGQEVLPSSECGLAHLFLFTKSLLKLEIGKNRVYGILFGYLLGENLPRKSLKKFLPKRYRSL